MRSLLRSIVIGAAALSGPLAMAQYQFQISGQVTPCNGVIYPIHIETNFPPLDTIIWTDSNCEYSFDMQVNTQQLGGDVTVSCDGGITWSSSTSFAWNNLLGVVFVDLTCPGGSNCNACFNTSTPQPFVVQLSDCTTGGTPPYSYSWNFDNLGTSNLQNPVLNLPPIGSTVYIVTLTVTDSNNVTCYTTDSVFVDSLGNMLAVDCMGIPGGSAMPGYACDDNNPLTPWSSWDWSCNCVYNGVFTDCTGQVNGPNIPGTLCDDGDPNTTNDTWDANCVCVGTSTLPCEAGFFVTQGYTMDSLGNVTPILNELWILNTSTGGNGTFTLLWTFGDGTSSTDPFPIHIYPNGGPYDLCLTIDDGAGCIDTYCDSISVDANGIYQGMSGDNGSRDAMTIHVKQEITNGVGEQPALEGLNLWPNPVTDELNMTVSSDLQGRIPMSVFDMSGRCVMAMYRTLTTGTNRFALPTEALEPGVYLLHMGNGRNALNQRFVKKP